MAFTPLFLNYCFDKSRLKSLITWSLLATGERRTIEVVERLKELGFQFATEAGTSLGVDDLKVPPAKLSLVSQAKQQVQASRQEHERGNLTALERLQQLVDTWHRTSETLKQTVVNHFQSTDKLSPVYMMAFSGARGNISQVRQLAGMRGLMADPQGQIIGFPIRSNFREGLTLIEYMISCYGARKGLVDTALRTADAGYLTRRLVDVSQHMVIRTTTCATPRGIALKDVRASGKIILPLRERLMGRVLAEDVTISAQPSQSLSAGASFSKPVTQPGYMTNQSAGIATNKEHHPTLLASRNQEISGELAATIARHRDVARVRSSLTCSVRHGVCQLCYGWSLSEGRLVTLGEAVGIIAAQSIGEPGTQLTMRTFHTGGVFSGEVMAEVRAPHEGTVHFHAPLPGLLVRTSHGKVAFLTKERGTLAIRGQQPIGSGNDLKENPPTKLGDSPPTKLGDSPRMAPMETTISIEAATVLFVRQGEKITRAQLLGEFSSMGVDRNETIEAKRTLFAELSGQIAFVHLLFGSPVKEDGSMGQMSKSLGLIWILSGQKSRVTPLLPPYGRGSHLVNRGSLMARILGSSPSNYTSVGIDMALGTSWSLGHHRWLPFTLPRAGQFGQSIAGQGLGKTHQMPIWGNDQPAAWQPNAMGEPQETFNLSPGMHLSHRQDGRSDTIGALHQQAILGGNGICLAPHSGYQVQLLNKGKRQRLSGHINRPGVEIALSLPWGSVETPSCIAFRCTARGDHRTPECSDASGRTAMIPTTQALTEIRNEVGRQVASTQRRWYPFSSLPPVALSEDSRPTHDWIAVNLPGRISGRFTSEGQAMTLQPPIVDNSSGSFSAASLTTSARRGRKLGHVPALSSIGQTQRTEPADHAHSHLPECTNGPHLSLFLGSARVGPTGIAWIDSRCADNHFVHGEAIWIQKQTPKSYKANALEWKNPILTARSLVAFERGRGRPIPSSPQAGSTGTPRFEDELLADRTKGTRVLIGQALVQSTRQSATNPQARVGSRKPDRRSGVGKPTQATSRSSEVMIDSQLSLSSDTRSQLNRTRSAITLNREPIEAVQRAGFVGLRGGFAPLTPRSWPNQIGHSDGGFARWHHGAVPPKQFKKERLMGAVPPTRPVVAPTTYQAKWLYCPVQQTSLPWWHESLQVCGEAGLDNLVFDPSPAYLEAAIAGQYHYITLGTRALVKMKVRVLAGKGRTKQLISGKETAPHHVGIISWFRQLVAQSQPICDGTAIVSNLVQRTWQFDQPVRGNSQEVGPQGAGYFHRLERESLSSRRPEEALRTEVLLFVRKALLLPRCPVPLADVSWAGPLGSPRQTHNHGSHGESRGQGRGLKQCQHYQLLLWRDLLNDDAFLWLRSLPLQTQIVTNRGSRFGPCRPILGEEGNKKGGEIVQSARHHTAMHEGQVLLPYLFEFTSCSLSTIAKFGSPEARDPESVKKMTITPGRDHHLPGTWLQVGRVVQLLGSRPIDQIQNHYKPIPSTLGVLDLNRCFTRPWLSDSWLFVVIRRGFRCPFPFRRNGDHRSWLSTAMAHHWTRSIGLFVPSVKQVVTKLAPSLPSPRWRMTPLISLDSFQTTVLSRPLHLVRFAAHLWTPLPGELIDVAIQLKANANEYPLHLFAAGKIRNVEKEGEKHTLKGSAKGSAFSLTKRSQAARTPTQLTPVNSPLTGEMVGASRSSTSPISSLPLLALSPQRLFLTEPDCTGLAIEDGQAGLHVGQFLGLGEQVTPGEATALPGQIIAIERKRVTLRRTQALLFYSQGAMHVRNGEWVDRGAPILTLTYQKLVTGDIVQGIPKIEQFFEAPTTRDGEPLSNSLQTRVRRSFERLRKIGPAPQAVKGSIEEIQQTLVEGILKVYLSQGVRIADKHLEIVVRQMTSKGYVLDAGDTGLFRGEQVDLGRIERLNLATYGKRANYEPAVLGITRAALDSDSFISAASFQETTRVLSRDTIIGKTDFLRGLKERVVLGDLIQAGTGLDDNINYGLLFGVAHLEQTDESPSAKSRQEGGKR